MPERVAMFTIAPEVKPYSALKVEFSTLNSCTVLIEGWKAIAPNVRLFSVMPLIMKLTASSRLPAVLNVNLPRPRTG